MRSIELTFDEESDAAVRAEWARLADADLPSLASHTAPSNSPHATLAAGADLAFLKPMDWGALPLEVEFGGILLFPAAKGRFVLARSLAVTGALLALHRTLHEAVGGAVDRTLPGRWSPHVTLARRLSPDQVAGALRVLGDIRSAVCTEARLWDGPTKTLTALSAPSPS